MCAFTRNLLYIGYMDEQCGLPTHEWYLLVLSSLTAAIFVVTLLPNCVLVELFGAGQCFRVPFALFCSEICSCTSNGVLELKNLPHRDNHQHRRRRGT